MITTQIVTEDINLDHLEETVKLLDLLYRVNKLKSLEEQILPKEFHNESINSAVDLRPQMAEWAKQTKI
jgi:hypothetical protein